MENGTNNEVNTRFVYALRISGKGFKLRKKICATKNQPNVKINI